MSAPLPSPYVGLRPFEGADRERFFGRDQDARRLDNTLFAAPMTVLYAASGTGKSSLLGARLVPTLQARGADVVRVDRWVGDPVATLLDALGQPWDGPSSPPAHALADALDARRAADAADELVVICDQFEELLARDGQRDALQALMRALAVVARRCPDVFMLLCLREERLARLRAFAGPHTNLLRNAYPLGHLDRRGVQAAIEGPAAQAGVRVEPALIERLCADLATARQPDAPVRLPSLQVVCHWLWASADGAPAMTLARYEALGGSKGIIRAYLAHVVDGFSRGPDALALVLGFLAPESGYKRPYSAQALYDDTRENWRAPSRADIDASLAYLAQAQVIQAFDDQGTLRYQLKHDAFIEVVQGWVKQQREARLARRARALALWTAGLLVLAVVLAGLTWLVGRQARQLAAQQVTLDQRQALLEAMRDAEVACILRDEGCAHTLVDAWPMAQLDWVWAAVVAQRPDQPGLADLLAIRPVTDEGEDITVTGPWDLADLVAWDRWNARTTWARRAVARDRLQALRGGSPLRLLRPPALAMTPDVWRPVLTGLAHREPLRDASVAFAGGLLALARGDAAQAIERFDRGRAAFPTDPALGLGLAYALLQAIEGSAPLDLEQQATRAYAALSALPPLAGLDEPLRQALAGYAGALARDHGADGPDWPRITAHFKDALAGLEAAPLRARVVSLVFAQAQAVRAAAPKANEDPEALQAGLRAALAALTPHSEAANLAALIADPRLQDAHRSEEQLALGRLQHALALAGDPDLGEEAEWTFGSASRKHDRGPVRVAWATVLRDQGRCLDADAQLEQALKHDPAYGPGYVRLAELLPVTPLHPEDRAAREATTQRACLLAPAFDCRMTRAARAAAAGDWAAVDTELAAA
ncbi:MAG: hypothetical protein KC613_14105, partial [Myxococcales bacterium]|nr:hypothetical protein [Myxococcales bacterium]